MWQTIHARYSNMRYEVPILVAEGDKVAATIRVFFRKRSNDRVVQFDIAAFYTLRDGRIAEIRQIMDTFDLVQQVLERDVVADLTGNKSARSDCGRSYFVAALNLAAPCRDQPRGLVDIDRRKHLPMKIALLVLLGLVLGALGGAALGVGAGLAWVEIFKTSSFEGYSGMLVFFTFMPLGAVIGGVGGALLFAVIAIRDAEIAVERQPAGESDP